MLSPNSTSLTAEFLKIFFERGAGGRRGNNGGRRCRCTFNLQMFFPLPFFLLPSSSLASIKPQLINSTFDFRNLVANQPLTRCRRC
eukprot:scaffold26646_cov155-Skeletonema_menzelii.AAC.8